MGFSVQVSGSEQLERMLAQMGEIPGVTQARRK
jgi:hypothetical protein